MIRSIFNRDFFRQHYVKGGESVPLISIGKVLKQYPESSELYKKYFIMNMLGLGMIFEATMVSSVLMDADESSFISVYLGSIVLGVFATIESYNKLNEAIWIYNREQLKQGNDGNDGNEFEGDSNDWRWREIKP